MSALQPIIRRLTINMRKRFAPNLELGQTPIEKVFIPTKSRDELPPTLAALQWIYKTPELNELVFTLLEEKVIGDKQNTHIDEYWIYIYIYIYSDGSNRLCKPHILLI